MCSLSDRLGGKEGLSQQVLIQVMVIKNYIVGNWTTETSPVGYERALKVFTDVENIEIDCTQSSSALLPLVYSCIVHQQQE